MGKRKKLAADARKAALKTQYFAKLRNVPSSPRKMSLLEGCIGRRGAAAPLGNCQLGTEE